MSEEKIAELKQQAETEIVARLKALKEAFPGDETYAVASFEAGLSLEQAKAGYLDVLKQRLDEGAKELAAAQADAKKLREENEGIRKQLLSGAKPVEPTPEQVSAGAEDVDKGIAQLQAEKKCTYTDAVRMYAKAHPEAARKAGL